MFWQSIFKLNSSNMTVINCLIFFFFICPNDRAYGHLAVPLHGMFHLRERSLPWNDKVNAGTKLPKCTACPESSGSASQWMRRVLAAAYFTLNSNLNGYILLVPSSDDFKFTTPIASFIPFFSAFICIFPTPSVILIVWFLKVI